MRAAGARGSWQRPSANMTRCLRDLGTKQAAEPPGPGSACAAASRRQRCTADGGNAEQLRGLLLIRSWYNTIIDEGLEPHAA
jgi:hypothetical protein